jgi:hypothetical protein
MLPAATIDPTPRTGGDPPSDDGGGAPEDEEVAVAKRGAFESTSRSDSAVRLRASFQGQRNLIDGSRPSLLC